MYNNLTKSNGNNIANNLGFTQADLLIQEIKKPNRPHISKNESFLKKWNIKNRNSFFSLDSTKYKNPKVRIKHI